MTGLNAGKYSIVLNDINGRNLQTGNVEIKLADETTCIPFMAKAKGIYVASVIDVNGTIISRKKIVK
jgi:hypothetical protein